MDFPDKEFLKIFETMIRKVDFSCCKTPEDVNQRLLAKIKEMESKSQSHNSSDTENRSVKGHGYD